MILRRSKNQNALKVIQKWISVKWMLRFFETVVITLFHSDHFYTLSILREIKNTHLLLKKSII